MPCPDRERFLDQVWGSGEESKERAFFAVLDLARDARIQPAVVANAPHFACLEPGRLSPAVQAAAPYLARVRRGSPLEERLLETGWGDSWGIFALTSSRRALEELRRHFHGLLRVRLPDGDPAIFRFFDPRIFRVFLPTCSRDQLKEMFGPVDEYWAESEDGEAVLRFRFDGERLERTRIGLASAPSEREEPEILPLPAIA